MNPFKNFDTVYCLNLPEREDRLNICLDNFKKYGIDNYEIFCASRFLPENPDSFSQKRIGQIGCMYSFCAMIDDALSRGHETVVFLEDDFDFVEYGEFINEFDKAYSELPKDWDMFYLGANVVDTYHKKPLVPFSSNLLKLRSGLALHSVCLSRKGLESIRGYFSNSRYWCMDLVKKYENLDAFLAQDYQYNRQCFIPRKILAYQRPDFSSIEGTFFDYNDLMNSRFNFFLNESTKG